MVQQDADALGLGVEVVAFTVGGMHPPVPVAADYEAVVSAEIGKVTAVVNAQAFRNQTVPAAEASVADGREHRSRGRRRSALARAAGEAWSFRTLESQYRAAPAGILLPPPSGDAGERSRGAQLHGRGFPLPAGWR